MQVNGFRNPDSFLGFLNHFKRHERRAQGYDMRPAFPPIIYQPSMKDCVNHFNMADLGAFTAGASIIFLISTFEAGSLNPVLAKHMINPFYKFRLTTYRINIAMAPFFGLLCAYINSYNRLNGETYNGNNWKNRRQKIRAALEPKEKLMGVRFWEWMLN